MKNRHASHDGSGASLQRTRVLIAAVGATVLLVLGGGTIWISSQDDGPSIATAPQTTDRAEPGGAVAAGREGTVGKTTVPRPSPPADQSTKPFPVPTRSAGADRKKNDAALAKIPQQTKPPVSFDERSKVTKGITARITQLEAVKGKAKLPGEVAGPALRFTVKVSNSTDAKVSTRSALVNVSAGQKEIPVIPLSGPGVSAFPPTIRSGESASATYVYNVPTRLRDQVKIRFNFRVPSPIAVFAGSAPLPKGQS